MVELKVRLDDGFQKKLDRIAREWPQKFAKIMTLASEIAKRETARLTRGPVLNVRTGALRAKTRRLYVKQGKDIRAGVQSGVHYHAYHEFGGPKTKKRPTLVPARDHAAKWLMRNLELWE